MDRRQLLAQLGAVSCFALPFQAQAQGLRKKVKITDVKVMIVRGPTWDWNLIKIETDAGVHGIGEAYWGPGVKDMIVKRLKDDLIGEDPLNVVKLYTKCLLFNGGYGAIAGITVQAASGIEIALWDLAGKLIGVPVCDLLGGRFRDKVRFYRTLSAPPDKDPALPESWRKQAHDALANNPFGFTAFKFQGDSVPTTADPTFSEPGHDRYTNQLTNRDIRRLVERMELVRKEIGPDVDMAVECHWKYSTNDVIQYCNALEPIHPMWVEDPTPAENVETMERVSRATNVPICTGENLYLLAGFRELIEKQACAGVHIDIPKSGGLFEAKRISDYADLYGIWTACHNPASAVGTIASAHAAASVRNFRVHELAGGRDPWTFEMVTHEGPFFKDGNFIIQDKPGLGVDLNPDVVKAHLAPDETWWG
ncbi:MAG TPA: mandelate racemase/muconate lactonizing enzyme family protein [Rhizomicrobium sp.]|jgi:L-alanine-DL-glutamate epimerase-like enolase superfamily enzyme|nr:mandelate racemase/muconate lactonizing enzyme family protein [Rhizomicrobium sp.]